MEPKPLSFDAGLDHYQRQAEDLLAAFRAGDADAIACFKHRHPRFLDEKIPWLPKRLSDVEVAVTVLDLADAQLALARRYDFRDWTAFKSTLPLSRRRIPLSIALRLRSKP